MSDPVRICFVCLGNIVRSPLAEALFRQGAEAAGVAEKYEVDSAGTGAWHVGEQPDSRMRRVAAGQGLRYHHRARQFQREDFVRFDLIIAMDTENKSDLERLARTPEQAVKIHTLREFDPQGGPRAVVPDPYYGGIDGFHETYRIVARATAGLLQVLESGEMDEELGR